MLQNIALPSASLPEHGRIMLHHHLHCPDIADHCTTICCATQHCKALVHLHYLKTVDHCSTIPYITQTLQNIAPPSPTLPRCCRSLHHHQLCYPDLQSIGPPPQTRDCRTLLYHHLHYPDTAEHCHAILFITQTLQNIAPPSVLLSRPVHLH